MWGAQPWPLAQGRAGRRPVRRSRLLPVDPIEVVFTTLLIVMSFVIMWFAAYVVYKLYKGQA